MYFSSNLLIEIILLVRKAVRAFGWLEMVYWAMNDFFISVHISLLKMIFSHTLRFFTKNADSLLIFAGTEKFIDNLLNLMGYDPSFMLQSVRNFQCLFLYCYMELCGITFYWILFNSFQVNASFYSSWKHQKTSSFQVFSEGIQKEHWPEMV